MNKSFYTQFSHHILSFADFNGLEKNYFIVFQDF